MSQEVASTRNPLQRQGRTQKDRCLEAMDTLFAKLDDRDLHDYLNFVFTFSDEINYYSHMQWDIASEKDISTWRTFFSDGLVLLAVLSRQTATGKLFRQAVEQLDDINWRHDLVSLMNELLSDLNQVQVWHSYFHMDDPFKQVLRKIMEDNVYKQKVTELETLKDETKDEVNSKDLAEETLLLIHSESIRILGGIILAAEKELTERLKGSDFDAHMGLLLSFLTLFEKSRDHLNSVGERHLKFHYEDVLQIERRPYQNDEVHVTVELAKHVDEYQLMEGTRFKAGNDSAGKPLDYVLIEDFVANKSTISSIRSSFVNQSGIVQAASNSQTLNGVDEPLPEDNPVWKPFTNENYPRARRGFALSSPVLRLRSGTRVITATFLLDTTETLSQLKKEYFKVSYSTVGKWSEAEVTTLTSEPSKISFEIKLDPKNDPVTDYNALLMEDGDNFNTHYPVLKIELDTTDLGKEDTVLNDDYYRVLNSIAVKEWDVHVKVEGVTDLVIVNDVGRMKADKPFMPLSSTPKVGSQFYVGHSEIFSKKLSQLSLNWNWIEAPQDDLSTYFAKYIKNDESDNFDCTMSLAILSGKEWVPATNKIFLTKDDQYVSTLSTPAEGTALDAKTETEKAFEEIKDKTDFTNEVEFIDLDKKLDNGFLRLKLLGPIYGFGHTRYPSLYQQAIIAATRQESPDDSLLTGLNQPYTPLWENISLDYESTDSSNSETMQFFSLEEFGYSEESNYLLTPFEEKARLYIGLDKLKAHQNVSLLFQFAEGTANPFLTESTDVTWSHITATGWQRYAKTDLQKDTTLELLQSGIIRLPVEDLILESQMMPDGLFWLRLDVNNDPELFNHIVSVSTQATILRFENEGNDLSHLESSLSAGAIAKLKVKDASVKSIVQPFASFGGMSSENDESYHKRVSERLRHKDRAIQIWDYEQLILQEFPEVHQAKCLNHTGRQCEDGDGEITYSEISPGDVTIVVVPTLENGNTYSLYKPAVKHATIVKIKNFLKERCSEWVNLEVSNPKYEQVVVSTEVQFHDEIVDIDFYKQKLIDDINDFLTPWAGSDSKFVFGNKIYKSVILNFIEEREYVDYLRQFDVSLIVEGSRKTFSEDEVTASSSLSLFVSSNAHDIRPF